MKIIFIDWGYYLHTAIFSHAPFASTYLCLTMLIGDIKKVGLDKDDIVIVAVDSPKGSWRRDEDSNYKGDRKAKREQYTHINWEKEYASFDELLRRLEMYTPFFIIRIDKLEADDIIAQGTRKFEDKNIIIISSDTDFEMLSADNVKIFSPKSKKYKIITNPYKVLAQKIRKEQSDNLLSPLLSEQDFKIRNRIVNLISLPKEIAEKVDEKLSVLPSKEWEIDNLPFPKLHERFKNIYNKNKIVKIKKQRKKKSRR